MRVQLQTFNNKIPPARNNQQSKPNVQPSFEKLIHPDIVEFPLSIRPHVEAAIPDLTILAELINIIIRPKTVKGGSADRIGITIPPLGFGHIFEKDQLLAMADPSSNFPDEMFISRIKSKKDIVKPIVSKLFEA